MNSEIPEEERDAVELFPHTRLCIDRIRLASVAHGYSIACSCKAKQRRRTFLYLIRRVKNQAYIDAYARIRHQAREKAEQEEEPAIRKAYEAVAQWAESLELNHLKE